MCLDQETSASIVLQQKCCDPDRLRSRAMRVGSAWITFPDRSREGQPAKYPRDEPSAGPLRRSSLRGAPRSLTELCALGAADSIKSDDGAINVRLGQNDIAAPFDKVRFVPAADMPDPKEKEGERRPEANVAKKEMPDLGMSFS